MKILTLLGVFIFSISALAMNGRTTYQAKIIKPDGYPLEASSVNFRFTVLDTVGSCVLYVEDYTAVNMSQSGGLISFALGNGARSFPASGTSQTFQNTFDNSVTSFSCQTPGIYNPLPTDTRRIVMQFNDGNGWQTLPAMTINTVPYAMYAIKSNDSKTLNGKADTAFVENSTLAALNCNSTTHAITFNGVSFSCIPVGSSSSGITSVTTSGTVLTTGGTASAPVISIKAVTMSQDGYLTSLDYAEFKAKLAASSTQIINTLGYAPVSGAAVATQINNSNLSGDVSGTISSNSVVSVGGKTAAQISTSVNDTLAATSSATADTIVKRNSLGNVTFNDIYANAAKINYVDIYKPSTSFNIRLQAPTSLSTNYVLNLPTTSGTLGQVLSTDGSGNLSWINAATGSVTSVSGSANEITSSGGSTPTLGLANTGIAGTYYRVTTDNKGRVTSGVATLTLSDLPASVLNTTSNFAGDISGMISNITLNRIQGVSVTITSLTTNDILQYDGSKYINKNIPTCTGSQYLTFNGTSFTCVADAGASGTITTLSVTVPLSSTGGSNPTLSIAQANSTTNGYLSSADWNTFNNKQNATSAAIIATLGYTPADNAVSGAYLQKANNLSDLTNAATARTNLGLGTLAVGNSIDLSSASAIGIIADARLLNQTNVASGMQYTKVTVDGKGRVVSGAQLSSSDVTTALGYTPANSTSGVTSLNGSTSQTQTFANGTAGTAPAYTTANGVHTLNIPLASAGSVTAGLISNADYASFANKITSSAVSIAQVLGYTPANSATITSSQWVTSGSNIYFNTGKVGVGVANPLSAMDVSGTMRIDQICDLSGLNCKIVSSGWSTGSVTQINTGAGLAGGPIVSSGTISLNTSGVSSGTYGSGTMLPTLTVDIYGRITAVSMTTIAPLWANITSKPTTLAGFGITDAVSTGAVIAVTQGGTGATTAASARTNLGLGSVAVLNTGASAGNVPVVGTTGLAANKMCTTDGSSGLICNLDIPTSSQWVSSGTTIFFNTGFVGIGTSSPSQRLSVAGLVESTSGGIKFPDGSIQSTAASGSITGMQTKLGSFASPAAVGAYSITGLGFSPKVVRFHVQKTRTGAMAGVAASVCTGTMTSTAQNAQYAYANTSAVRNLIYTDRVIACSDVDATTITIQAGYVSMDADGFTINFSPAVSGWTITWEAQGGATVASAGSGTSGYLPVWTSSTGLGNSPLSVSGASVGLGTVNPESKFHIESSALNQPLFLVGNRTDANASGVYFERRGPDQAAPINIQGTKNGVGPMEIALQLQGGNVGIGTSAPTQRLSVAGVVESTSGGFKFPDGSVQASANGLSVRGVSPTNPATSCTDAKTSGFTVSGLVYITVSGTVQELYCEQSLNGGGYLMLYNSVLAVNTTEFWYIPKAQLLSRRGSPRLESNFYDGSFYTLGTNFMDVIEDLRGKQVIALVATATSFDSNPASAGFMKFSGATRVSGDTNIFNAQFASGFSAPDYDNDAHTTNCANDYSGVSQHYSACWGYNLGSDADSPFYDGGVGPHMQSAAATSLGLYNDGTGYTRLRRITRFVKF